jgi:transcriptional regulator with XRE-family HTH domain
MRLGGDTLTLKELRERKNLSQIDLARLIGVSQQVISHYETGRARPSLDVIVKLAKVLGVSIEEIYEALPKKEGAKL